MNVALVGSSGYIAEFLLRRFAEEAEIGSVLKIGRGVEADAYLNLEEAEKFQYSLLNPVDYVVFTAGISGPDQCAREFDVCWKINVTGTAYFIHEALKRNCRVLFFSSDAVLGDLPRAIYDENSETRACTPYGRMKKAVEDEFKGEPLFKAIRLSYVASAKDRFHSYCLNCIRTGETAEVFHPFYRNVITVSDVIEVVLYFAFHWEEFAHPVLNVAGKELISRVRMADEVNRLFDGRLQYTVTRPEEDFFANRPRIIQMKSLYLQKYGILSDNTYTEKIAKELEETNI